MRTVAVAARARTLNELFRKAQREGLILQAHDGRRFVLASLEGWEAFEVGEDITQNKRLMKFLVERRSGGKPVSLGELKAELGIK